MLKSISNVLDAKNVLHDIFYNFLIWPQEILQSFLDPLKLDSDGIQKVTIFFIRNEMNPPTVLELIISVDSKGIGPKLNGYDLNQIHHIILYYKTNSYFYYNMKLGVYHQYWAPGSINIDR